jgi:hypothetical protein
MTTYQGLQESIYLGGVNLVRNPDSVQISFAIAETRQRARDGTLLVDRAAPYTGAGLRISKANLALGWTTMQGGDIDTVNDLIAYGGPIDICIWRPQSEAFASYSSGTLARRSAIVVIGGAYLPANYASLYAHAGADAGGHALTVSLGSIDTHYRTPWTATGGSTGIGLLRYYPVYRMYVAEGQPSFSRPFQQGQTLNFEEA